MAYSILRQTIFIVLTLCGFTKVYAKDYFTAAVFEHARRGDGTSDPPAKIIADNLNMYERAATLAKENNADMIVFPEYGICHATERKDLGPCMEDISDPNENVIPCLDESSSSSKPILKGLSCIARKNKINVIANTGDVKNCNKGSQCPEDGKLYYNTNVVFDRDGKLLHRYHERHQWFESSINEPTEKQDITFTNDVGYFAYFIGLDIEFSKASPDSVPDTVDAVLYLTEGVTRPPLLISSSLWQAWAMGNNMTVLAANLQIPGDGRTGSGIYAGRGGAIVNTYSPDGISKLIISKVPKRNKEVFPDTVIYAISETDKEVWNPANEHVSYHCDINILGPPKDVYKDYRCTSEDLSNYTLVKLEVTEGYIKACNKAMCCELEYAADSTKETYYFGVFSGIHNVENKFYWAEENCFLARCDDVNGKHCAEFLMQSNTTFRKIKMRATFTTKYIYPQLVSSEMKLVPVTDWKYETEGNQGSIDFNKKSGIKLLVAGLTGRNYDRDRPHTNQN